MRQTDILFKMDQYKRSPGATAGAQIKRRREQRGITAAELSRRAGIGKASLSSIEAGRGNPTIDTLYAIAFALRLPLTDLLAEEESAATVYQPSTPRLEGEVARELLLRVNAGQNTEIWRLRIPPYTAINGVPHAPGTVEHLLVASGALTAGTIEEPAHLNPGDFLAFRGDVPHNYETFETDADVTVFIVSPAVI